MFVLGSVFGIPLITFGAIAPFVPADARVPVANRTSCGDGNICCNGACCSGCCNDVGRTAGTCGSCLTFITSTTHSGNLGGLDGADRICQDPHAGYQIRVAPSCWAELRSLVARSKADRGADVETGGQLFGERDDAAGVIWVSDVSGPPTDSSASADGFVWISSRRLAKPKMPDERRDTLRPSSAMRWWSRRTV